jgi:hypothetical protein
LAARKSGACEEALAWLEAEPRTLDDLCEHQDWLAWAACYQKLTAKQFNVMLEKGTVDDCLACYQKLTAAQFDVLLAKGNVDWSLACNQKLTAKQENILILRRSK